MLLRQYQRRNYWSTSNLKYRKIRKFNLANINLTSIPFSFQLFLGDPQQPTDMLARPRMIPKSPSGASLSPSLGKSQMTNSKGKGLPSSARLRNLEKDQQIGGHLEQRLLNPHRIQSSQPQAILPHKPNCFWTLLPLTAMCSSGTEKAPSRAATQISLLPDSWISLDLEQTLFVLFRVFAL